MAAFLFSYNVGFSDVDAASKVYFPRFFHICHLALEALFRELGPVSYPEMIHSRGLGLPIVHVEADYKKPLLFGDSVLVGVTNRTIKNSSVVMHYQFMRKPEDIECFSSDITTVCMDLEKHASILVPDDLRAFFISLQL